MKYDIFNVGNSSVEQNHDIRLLREEIFNNRGFDRDKALLYDWFCREREVYANRTIIANSETLRYINKQYRDSIFELLNNEYSVDIYSFDRKYELSEIGKILDSVYLNDSLVLVDHEAYKRELCNDQRISQEVKDWFKKSKKVHNKDCPPISKDAKEALREVSQLPTDERYRVDPSMLKKEDPMHSGWTISEQIASMGKHKHTMVPIFNNLPMALDKTFVSICRCSECGYTEKYTMNLMNGIFTWEEIKC